MDALLEKLANESVTIKPSTTDFYGATRTMYDIYVSGHYITTESTEILSEQMARMLRNALKNFGQKVLANVSVITVDNQKETV